MADQLPKLLEDHREEIKLVLPPYIDLDRFIANARTLANDRNLQGCSPDSVFRCCLEAARKGWEVGGTEKHCAVVPFKLKSGGVTAILLPQWQGRAFTWHRSGAIKKLKAEVVYVGDVFEIESGDEDRIIHRPDFTADRAPKWLNTLSNIVGAYAIAWLWSNERVHTFVSRSQIQRVMESVKRKNNNELGFGWTDWLPEMCRKTAIHRLAGVIQPPPDMTPEQIEAWNRANAATTSYEVEVSEEAPDNLPRGEGLKLTPDNNEETVVQAEEVRKLSADEAGLLRNLAVSLKLKPSAYSQLLFDNFKAEDFEELDTTQVADCERIFREAAGA